MSVQKVGGRHDECVVAIAAQPGIWLKPKHCSTRCTDASAFAIGIDLMPVLGGLDHQYFRI
jgi:hypothetical protein